MRLLSLLLLFVPFFNYASEIIDVLPVTDKILLVHFDDGDVNYPNDLQVNRLVISNVTNVSNWSVLSADDNDYTSAKQPSLIGRKSKGTEFVKDVPWGGSSSNPTSKPWASEHWIYLVFDKSMKEGNTYTLNSGSLATNGTEWSFKFNVKDLRSESIHVNTVGYASDAPKYGYIYQWMGDLGGLSLSEYANTKFWIYKEGSDTPVKEGAIRKRKSATNIETGQPKDTPNQNFLGGEVYDCEFSDITEDGSYYLVVEGIGRSYPFKIGTDALFNAYYGVMRALYYQRSGIRLEPPYSTSDYIRPVNQNTKVTSDDGTSFAGKLLYSKYPYTSWADHNSGGSSQEAIRNAAIGNPLDVAGWYHDAGDWDQYSTHEKIPVLLMLTYEFAPDRFCDADLNIPESGNGIPDIIDEASWLIKLNYRMRKELMTKGYSDGGVGGSRICADVFTSVDGNAESSVPSWKEFRRTIVTQADAFMTYMYAGQAAQFSKILKSVGKNPFAFRVENLDNVDFESMTYDTVNWVTEAKAAYEWAGKAENQPENHNNYKCDLKIYKLYAAVNLFRITNDETYHAEALSILDELKTASSIEEEEGWGIYSYLLADNQSLDNQLKNDLVTVVINNANNKVYNSIEKRACRWGGVYDMPMLVGQATTPWIFEALVAFELSGDKKYKDAIHTTADYFLGTNPLHTTWMTGIGPRPATAGFHLDSRYNHNWVVYPGFIPYGPWSMNYGFVPYTYTIDGVSIQGGHGPWNKDWANFSQYPVMDQWPGHERWNSNIHAPSSSENTVHQNTVFGGLTYGYANSRHHKNGSAAKPITSITLANTDITLQNQGADTLLNCTFDISDATFGALIWKSSDTRIAFVDHFGRVTGITPGSCTISVSTLDESVSAQCLVTCSWPEISVENISIEPDTIALIEGQKKTLVVTFNPSDATNKFVDWSYSADGIVSIDENGVVSAITPGEVWAIANSLNGNKKDTCRIYVAEAKDFIIADFDLIVPVTSELKPDSSQIYTPTGSNDIAFLNPLQNETNSSAHVVKWDRPSGDWKLLGIVLPTDSIQDLSKFAQFQFKYYGSQIVDFFIQLIMDDNSKIEITEPINGEDCWQLFAYDLNLSKSLKQFNIFANKQGNPAAIPILFDDFKLAGKASLRYDDLSLSDSQIELNSQQTATLIANANGNPFFWISSNPSVATVDQNGSILALSGGTTLIKAVPLFGNAAECEVVVDGGVSSAAKSETLLDFETIELNWSGGYGAYSWGTDSIAKTANPLVNSTNNSSNAAVWKRDGSQAWAGFGIQFPENSTIGWDNISFQALATSPVTTIRVEILNGDVSIGSYTFSNLTIQSNSWENLIVDISDLGATNKSFNKLIFQIAGGSTNALYAYVDNIKLNTTGEVRVASIDINETNPINKLITDLSFKITATLLPEDAVNKKVDWYSTNQNIFTIDTSGTVKLKGVGSAWAVAISNDKVDIKDSIQINISPVTAGLNILNSKISVSPNPFDMELIITKLNDISRLEITNILGNKVYSKNNIDIQTITIQTDELSSGIYLIHFYTSTGNRITKKIIKK